MKRLVLAVFGLALFLGWQWGSSLEAMYGIGILLGFSGASVAIALPLASQAYPPNFQGLAMGVAAVGNSGALIASLVAPRLAQYMDWSQVFGLMLVPVMVTFFIFFFTVQGDSRQKSLSRVSTQERSCPYFLKSLKDPFMYWLCFLYAVTFGGFVGFSSYLPIFLHDQFQVGMVLAGIFATVYMNQMKLSEETPTDASLSTSRGSFSATSRSARVSGRRAVATTSCPRRANSIAASRPKPVEQPVIKTLMPPPTAHPRAHSDQYHLGRIDATSA